MEEDVVERAFGAVRGELEGGVRDEGFEGKLRAARMKGRPWGVMAMVVGAMVLMMVGVPVWWVYGHAEKLGAPLGAYVPIDQATLGDVVITQRLAYRVSDRAVVVAWEATGEGEGGTLQAWHHHGYEEVPLRRERVGGMVFHVSVFVADGGVEPMLRPPTMVARTGRGETVGFAVSPLGLRGWDAEAAMAEVTPAGVRAVTRAEVAAARM